MKKVLVFLMILTIAISPLFRGLFFYYEQTIFLTIIALLSFVYFLLKLKDREAVHCNKWSLLFGALLVAAYGLAFITAVNTRENISAILLVAQYLLLTIILFDYYHEKKETLYPTLFIPVIITGFINSVIGIESITGAYEALRVTFNYNRLGGTFQYANTGGIYFALILILSLTLMYALNKPLIRIILSGANNVILLALLLTRSRGGYIVGFAALIFLMLIQAKGYRLKSTGSFICAAAPALLLVQRISVLTASRDSLSLNKLLLISLAGAIFLAALYEIILLAISKIKIKPKFSKPFFKALPYVTVIIALIAVILLRNQIISLIPHNIIERFARISLEERNIAARITFDKDALKLISDNWLLGTGGGSWQILYYNVQEFYYISRAVHNHFFEIFVESGILGFISFTAIFILSVYYMIRALLKTADAKPRIYMAGLFTGFMALVIHSTFDFNLSYVSLGLLFWAMVVMSLPADKHIIVFRKSLTLIIPVVASIALLVMNGMYSLAAHNASIGNKLKSNGEHNKANTYYEEAIRLDSTNSEYTFQLNKLYNLYANISKTPEQKETWLKAALHMAKMSISLNPYLPENNRLLIRAYYNLDMPLEGLEYAEKLIEYQPYNNVNYELLAKGYLEAGKDYLDKGTTDKAHELLNKCLEIDPPEKAEGESDLSAIIQEVLTILE